MTQKKQTTQPLADGKVDPIRAELATTPSTQVGEFKPMSPPEAAAEPQQPEVTEPVAMAATAPKADPVPAKKVAAPRTSVLGDDDDRRVTKATKRLEAARKALETAEAARNAALEKLSSKRAKEVIAAYGKLAAIMPGDSGYGVGKIFEIIGEAVAGDVSPVRLLELIKQEVRARKAA
jgi:hypothetical protein